MMSNEDMYHICRWCKHFTKGCCTLGVFSPVLVDSVYNVAEDGGLSSVIEETLNSKKPEKLIRELDVLLSGYRVAKAKRDEIRKLILEELLEYNDFVLKEELDSAISRLYQERLDNATVTEEVEIKSPEDFYCSRWE